MENRSIIVFIGFIVGELRIISRRQLEYFLRDLKGILTAKQHVIALAVLALKQENEDRPFEVVSSDQSIFRTGSTMDKVAEGDSNAFLAFAKPLVTVCRLAALAPIRITYYNNKYNVDVVAETVSAYVTIFFLYAPSYYYVFQYLTKMDIDKDGMYYILHSVSCALLHVT